MGKWEITVSVIPQKTGMDNRSLGQGGRDLTPFEEKYTVEKPTETDAIKEALLQANKANRGNGPKRGPHEYKYKSSKVLQAPSGPPTPQAASSSGTDVRAVAENVLGALSNSNEFAGLIAEAKNLEKMVSKLGGAGKVFTGVGIAADLVKYYETFVKLAQTTDKNKKKEYTVELLKICASLTKTTITIAFPPAGIVDAAVSSLMMAGEQIDKALEKKLQDKTTAAALTAMREKYPKEGNALKPNQEGYAYEMALYSVGFSMNDILEKRRYYQKLVDMTGKIKNPYKSTPGFVNSGGYFNMLK